MPLMKGVVRLTGITVLRTLGNSRYFEVNDYLNGLFGSGNVTDTLVLINLFLFQHVFICRSVISSWPLNRRRNVAKRCCRYGKVWSYRNGKWHWEDRRGLSILYLLPVSPWTC